MRRRGKSADLSASLGRLVSRLDGRASGGYLQVKAALAWEAVAGESIVVHTTGAHLRNGEMVVFVDSPIWATELSALAEEYRTRINKELGAESVRSMRFTVSKRVEQARTFEDAARRGEEEKAADKVESVPLSDQERAQVEASAAQIESKELREAVVRATIADLEWKKGIAKGKAR